MDEEHKAWFVIMGLAVDHFDTDDDLRNFGRNLAEMFGLVECPPPPEDVLLELKRKGKRIARHNYRPNPKLL